MSKSEKTASGASTAPSQGAKPQGRKPGRPRSLLRFGLKAVAGSLALSAVGFATLLLSFAITMPDPFAARKNATQPTVQIVARDGTLLSERGRPHDYIPLALLPLHVCEAVIATEDRRFYQHWGIDPWGTLRAAMANLRAARYAQGGSTLTQQLAKNLFLSNERTLKRKLDELALAAWLEIRLTKRQILELYLNQVYLGAGTYGIEAAAQKYFGVSANRLTVAQAAIIAGLLKAPSRYSPHHDPAAARARGRTVLSKMYQAGAIDEKTWRQATREPVTFKPPGRHRMDPAFGHALSHILDKMPPLGALKSSLIVVETTIDARVQRRAYAALKAEISQYGANARQIEGAVVALSPDGGIRALVGGKRYLPGAFNRAIKARRQTGSAFKPIVYLAALESGLKPGSIVYDLPIRIGKWQPRNASGRNDGAITMRDALARSLNTVAVRLQQRVGISAVRSVATRLGITSALARDATVALGTSEIGLLELTGGYAVFANGGLSVTPHIIARVRTGAGRILYAHNAPPPHRVFKRTHIADINDMLSAATRYGTARRARISEAHPIAGKTGTTQNGRDAWFIGYSRHLVTGVWIGTDTGEAARQLSGGQASANVFRQIMQEAHVALRPRPLSGHDIKQPQSRPRSDQGAKTEPQVATAPTSSETDKRRSLPPLPKRTLRAPSPQPTLASLTLEASRPARKTDRARRRPARRAQIPLAFVSDKALLAVFNDPKRSK